MPYNNLLYKVVRCLSVRLKPKILVTADQKTLGFSGVLGGVRHVIAIGEKKLS